MTAVATAWAVESADGRQFKVSRESSSRVKITWLCGDVVEFSPSTLEEAVRNLRLVASHGVWLRVKPDYAGSSFAVAIIDGELYAERNPVDEVSDSMHVTWAEVEELIAPAPPIKGAPTAQTPWRDADGMRTTPERRGGLSGWLRERLGR